jgi:hypothetical protein
VFGGVEHAAAELKSDLENEAKVTGEERALIHEADAAWIDPLLGTYKDPDLGTIRISRVKDRIVFDAGEWQTDIGKKIDRDGTVKLVTIVPPFVGFELVPTEKGLVIDAGQQVYTFVKEQK